MFKKFVLINALIYTMFIFVNILRYFSSVLIGIKYPNKVYEGMLK